MSDDDTFIVSNALQNFSNSQTDSNDVLGHSKIQYTFLPYLFNRDNNRVVDVCGNILVSGNIESLDGRLYVGQTSIFNGDVSMNSRLFVAANVVFNEVTNMEKDSTLTQRLFVLNDVSLSSRFFVKENTIHDGDVSMNSRLFVADDVSMNSHLSIGGDVSLNQDLQVLGDVSLNKSLTVSENLYVTGNVNLTRFNNEYITNIETQNYSLIIAEDASINGRLYVTEDTSLNGRLFVKENSIFDHDVSLNTRLFVLNDASFHSTVFIDTSLGIGIHHPMVSLDVSSVNAIKIPRGTINERPETTSINAEYHAGYIRYNTENSQFEGYGPGNSWGSLGGVINVLQNTKITAANPNADSQNNELLFFTSDASAGEAKQRMIIDPEGKVGIGQAVPQYTLDVTGDARITSQCDAASFNATSDKRLKDNINPVTDSLSKVLQLQGVDYSWISDSSKDIHSGFIAQEVEKVIPQVVKTNDSENQDGIKLKTINYNGIIPYLVESVKELTRENDNLKQEIEALRYKQEELEESTKKYDLIISDIMSKIE